MSRLARLSLANRSLVALATIAVIVFGLVATTSLRQELIPSLQLPAAVITTPYPGASPEIVEREVSAPIERAIEGADGLTATTSTSRNGLSIVQAEFDYGTDIDAAAQELQQAVGRLAAELPEDTDPTVQTGSIDDLPVVMLAAAVGGNQAEAAQVLRDTVVPELEAIDGVRAAEVTGVREEQVAIRPDPRRLAQRGLSPAAITTTLQANGVAVPGGTMAQGDQALSVQVGGVLDSVEELRALPLLPTAAPAQSGTGAGDAGAGNLDGAGSGGRDGAGAPAGAGDAAAGDAADSAQTPAGTRAAPLATIGDVAEVTVELEESTSLTRTNGQPTLGVMVTKTPDGSTVSVSHAVQDKLPELESALGGAGAFTVVFDQAPFIEQSIEGLTTEGLLGLGFAILVILVFLLSVRSTIVTAVSIPLSLLIAMIGLYAGGYSLNILTLGALTVAIGRVVDDSIVVLENIKRHLDYGEERRQAIITGVREVAGAVTASTVTTAAVFLPIALVGGMVGELFRPFGITVAVALMASLLVSLTIIPVLASWFMRPVTVAPADAERVRRQALDAERRSPLQRAYLPVIRWVTRRRATTLLIGVVLFAGTLAMAPLLDTNFLETPGQNTVTVTQELPVGTSLERTDEAAAQVERVLAELDEVETYQTTIGSSGMGGGFFSGGSPNEATFSVTTDPDIDQEVFQDELRARLDGLESAGELRLATAAGFGAPPLEVTVQAGDDDALREAAGMVEEVMRGIPGAVDVSNNLAEDAPSVRVTPDRGRAAALGLTDAQIGQAVRGAFVDQAVGTVVLDGEQRDVVLDAGDQPASVEELRRLPVSSPLGRSMRLADVAEVEEVNLPVARVRTDGESSASVTATPEAADVGAVSAELQQELEALTLPDGATWELGGVTSEQNESFAQLGVALLAAIAIVYIVMVGTFRSLLQPLILLVSVPFAATGALGGLLVTGTALGVPALIGMLMLVGIVVTNAIVLIDLINQYRAQGRPVQEAVVEGARQRLRPILMTALATIFALTPMAFGLTGEGVFISQPLAIVVIGGLISSTLLTLVLVPTLYTMLEGRRERRRARRVPATPAPAPEPATAGTIHAPEPATVSANHPAGPAGPMGGFSDAELATVTRFLAAMNSAVAGYRSRSNSGRSDRNTDDSV